MHDFFCAVSGISLLGREVAWLLLEESDSGWQIAALPLFGRYNGVGGIEDLEEGPGAQLLLSALLEAQAQGVLQVDFPALGLECFELDDADLLFSLFFCAGMHGPSAITFAGRNLRFAMVSAHILAELTTADPELPQSVNLETLADYVFTKAPTGRQLYAKLTQAHLGLRCRFGLSLLKAQSFQNALQARQCSLEPAGTPSPFEAKLAASGLLLALKNYQSDPEVLAGLHALVSDLEDEEESKALLG